MRTSLRKPWWILWTIGSTSFPRSVRRNDKQRILKRFEEAFTMPEYLYSQEFPYLFLLFSIIFCKSVSKTAQIIQEKFRVSDKQKDKHRISVLSLKERNIAVCAGTETHEVRFGDIYLSNYAFKRKFSLLKESVHIAQQRVSNFFDDASQKQMHTDLMI